MNFEFGCRRCDSALEAETSMIGQKLQCPSCGNAIVVPPLEKTKKANAKYVEYDYPIICKVAGISLLILALLNILGLILARMPDAQKVVSIFYAFLFLGTGLCLLFKKRAGVFGSYFIFIIFSLSAIIIFTLGMFSELPIELKFTFFMFLLVNIVLIVSTISYNKWLLKTKSPEISIICPYCKSDNILEDKKAKTVTCAFCDKTFKWEFKLHKKRLGG